MKVHMEGQEGMKDITDHFMELSEEHRGGVLVQLLCRDASLSKRSLEEEMLYILTGIRDYVDCGLKSKTLNEIDHKKGIQIVKGLYDAVLKHMESHATDDE